MSSSESRFYSLDMRLFLIPLMLGVLIIAMLLLMSVPPHAGDMPLWTAGTSQQN